MKYVRKSDRPPIAAPKKGAPARSEAKGRRGCRGKAPRGGGACGRRGRSEGALARRGRRSLRPARPARAERPRARVPRSGEHAGQGRSAPGGRGGKNTPPEGRPLTGEAGGGKKEGPKVSRETSVKRCKSTT